MVKVITPEKRIDNTNHSSVLEEIKAAIAEGPEELVIDLHQVTFLNSSGLGVLIKAWKLAQGEGISFRVRGCNHETVKVVLQATKLELLFPIE